ncbi:MAG TPA: isoprenylcysteine carboxylmethyltransferase family protein [Candidatus Cybelea sp.]|nr:isoprenylcysteine carboxylmethyltransferase family protein [Candidatus Cybelea sp.]
MDKGSSRLWDVGHLIGVIGVIIGFTSRGHIQHWSESIAVSGFACMLTGIFVRWLAILTLGEHFTGRVAICSHQRLVEAGLYRHVRHPAYAGALLAYLGMGLAFANWISIVLLFSPILLAALYRIQVEEAVLSGVFGDEYAKYSARTKRLVPWIY